MSAIFSNVSCEYCQLFFLMLVVNIVSDCSHPANMTVDFAVLVVTVTIFVDMMDILHILFMHTFCHGLSITSTTEEAAPTTGRQEQRSTEYPSDQWQVSTYPCVVLHTHRYWRLCSSYACLLLWNRHYAVARNGWMKFVSITLTMRCSLCHMLLLTEQLYTASGAPQLAVVKVSNNNTQCQSGWCAVEVSLLHVAYCYCMRVVCEEYSPLVVCIVPFFPSQETPGEAVVRGVQVSPVLGHMQVWRVIQ